MNAPKIVIAALALVVVPPAANASVDTDACYVRTTPAFTPDGETYFAGAYASGTTVGAEIWQETNGIEGLQKQRTSCSDGRVYEADTCLSTGGSPTCARQAVFETV